MPQTFTPSLICVTSDAGFGVGQSVSLDQFTISGGQAAFEWSFDAINLYFTQLGAPIVTNPTTGSLVVITPASWQLQAQASALSNYAGVSLFPALNYELANPEGAFTFGTHLYTFSQSQFSNSGKYYVNQYDLLSNEVTPLAQIASASGLKNVNGAVFGSGFFSTGPTFLLCSSGGIYTFAATNPGTNLITADSTYDSTGAASVNIASAGTYIWSPSSNDTSITVSSTTYLASNAVNGQIAITTSGSATGALAGAPGTVITGTLFTTTAAWSPTLFSSHLGSGVYKPVWYVSTPTATAWCVSSDDSTSVSHLDCYKVTSTAATKNTWATNNTAQLDLTDSSANGIVNVAQFQLWHPAGSTAKILLFQYNPIKKRIYVITDEVGVMHIFKITASSNDFQAWWNTASPGREIGLSYVKSIAMPGLGTIVSSWSQCHYTVEFDQNSGTEICVVFTRDGSGTQLGSVTRIPWVEALT
jgi:hypothetical protein